MQLTKTLNILKSGNGHRYFMLSTGISFQLHHVTWIKSNTQFTAEGRGRGQRLTKYNQLLANQSQVSFQVLTIHQNFPYADCTCKSLQYSLVSLTSSHHLLKVQIISYVFPILTACYSGISCLVDPRFLDFCIICLIERKSSLWCDIVKSFPSNIFFYLIHTLKYYCSLNYYPD